MKKSGILMPVSSLPSAYGIGALDSAAYHFVDQLQRGASALAAGRRAARAHPAARDDRLGQFALSAALPEIGKSVFSLAGGAGGERLALSG